MFVFLTQLSDLFYRLLLDVCGSILLVRECAVELGVLGGSRFQLLREALVLLPQILVLRPILLQLLLECFRGIFRSRVLARLRLLRLELLDFIF